VVTNCDHLAQLKFSPVLPHAFTEHGAIMAATVLNGPPAALSQLRYNPNMYRAPNRLRPFVLHVFQKKSKSEITTPKQEMDLIERRLKVAAARVKELRNEQAQGK
jgi:hypothetical protein